ncbi:MAG: lysophospholipid acyltransferase family protein [Myxococcales bacterium]|nr:lysophospholipid acyltransferase family protein [Myxococcales bacterium]
MTRTFARLFLRLSGWQPEGNAPTCKRYVLIASPHTSNWDLAYMLAIASVLRVKIHWMGKHTLFRFPLGWLMRSVGGIAIDRRAQHGVVKQVADRLKEADELVMVVPPEGTRRASKYWKSGFYHIAREAQVPVVCGFLDYRRKRGGFGPAIELSGNVRADMDRFREFYAPIQGKFPQKATPPRLREEE